MTHLDEKARFAAIRAANEIAIEGAPVPDYVDGIIRAYLSDLPSSPVSELEERLDTCAVATFPIDQEAATTLTSLSTRNAELEREVKRLREAVASVVAVSKAGHDTVSFLVELHRVSLLCAAALSTSPQGGEHA